MKVIIIGIGKVGYAIAEYLSAEDNDVAVIDNKDEALAKAEENLDVIGIKGNGMGINSLMEAGLMESDLVIATTSSDEINILCCMLAKHYEVPHVIARIRDPEYSSEIPILKNQIGLDMVINPEMATAIEISHILQYPMAISVDHFAGGKADLVAFKIIRNDNLAGKSLQQVKQTFKQSILFCVVLRKNETVIPDGNFVLQELDVVYIIGQAQQVMSFFKQLGRNTHRVRSTIIIGGGRIGYYLSKIICKSGIKVKIIERNYELCQFLDEALPDCLVINGDGTDDKLLLSENIQETGAVVCLTGKDEENLITALYASQLNGPKAIAKINRENYEGISKDLGIDSIISPKNVTSTHILRFVRALKNSYGNNMEMLYRIVGGQVEVLQFQVGAHTNYLNKPFKDVDFKKNCLVVALRRGDKIIIPTGADSLQLNDQVIIAAHKSIISDLNDIFQNGGSQR